MSGSTRRSLFLLIVVVLVIAESLYFGRQVFAGYQQLAGRSAFSNGEFARAWESYGSAIRWGGDRVALEGERLDLLVFAMLQREAGIDLDLPVSGDDALPLAWSLARRQLQELPYEAHAWMKLADLMFYEARQARREQPIDVSRLSETARDNLLAGELAGAEALRTAASLEPNNYFYHNLLVSFYMEIGAPEEAAPHVRDAVSSYPRLDGHYYLTEREVPEEMLEAAIAGFRVAAERDSLVRKAYMLVDAGRLLLRQKDEAGALTFFDEAVTIAPDLFDAHYHLGQALYRTGEYPRAIEHLTRASILLPADSSTLYYLGRTHQASGDLSAAIDSLTAARQKRPDILKFRHELGDVLEEAGRIDEAERQFVSAANLRPNDSGPWLALIRFYSRTGARASALQACDRLLDLESGTTEYQAHCESLKLEPSR